MGQTRTNGLASSKHFLRALVYAQLCHIPTSVSGWRNNLTNVLKNACGAQFGLAFRGPAAIQREGPLGAAQPGWQISGEASRPGCAASLGCFALARGRFAFARGRLASGPH